MSDPCPACGAEDGDRRRLAVRGLDLRECPVCGLRWQPTPDPGRPAYDSDRYYDHWAPDATGFPAGALKLRTLGRCLDLLLGLAGPHRTGGRLLDVGCAQGQMLEAARQRGLEPWGIEISPAADAAVARGFRVFRTTLDEAPLDAASMDFVTLIDVIEHVEHPVALLASVRRRLRPGGLVLVLTPDVRSASARLLGAAWPHYKPEHLLYLSRRSLGAVFARADFAPVRFSTAVKYLSIDYVLGDLRRYGQLPVLARLPRLEAWVPERLRSAPVPVPSGFVAVARRVDPGPPSGGRPAP